MGNLNTVIYTGEYRHNRDAKGRLTVPSKWRPQGIENEEFLALPNPKGWISVYPPKRAEKLIERISNIDLAADEEQEALVRLSSMAQTFSFDAQGRINLDPILIEYAGIGKEVVLQGNFATFSIWSQARYDDFVSGNTAERSAKLVESLPKLGGI